MAKHTKQTTNIRWYFIINTWKFHYVKTYQTNKQTNKQKTNKKTKQKTTKNGNEIFNKWMIFTFVFVLEDFKQTFNEQTYYFN